MKRRKCFLITLSAIVALAVIAGAIGISYLSEINRPSTLNSSHKSMFPLAASESDITEVKIVSAFYDPEVSTYQIRIRYYDLSISDLLGKLTLCLTAGGVTHETFKLIHCEKLWRNDLILLFEDAEFDKNCQFFVGNHSCRLSPRS